VAFADDPHPATTAAISRTHSEADGRTQADLSSAPVVGPWLLDSHGGGHVAKARKV
jgi:hypothetical protein